MRSLGLTALVCVLAAGCGGGGETTGKALVDTGPAFTPDLEAGATITGKVTFEGEKPVAKPIDMESHPACAAGHKDSPAMTEDAVVNPNGTLRWAFVWVKAGLTQTKWVKPAAPVVLDQSGCVYTPHVLGLQTGQNLEIRNSDPTNHNVHPVTKNNSEWNETQPPNSGPKLRTFDHPEIMVQMKCNVHPWMRSFVGVVDHPFFAVTGGDGTFTIKGLPPGTYTIETWHEKYGTRDRQVTVGARESKTVDFAFKG